MLILRPLYDRVIVRCVSQEEISKGGIVIPDVAQERPEQGKVIAVGPGRKTEEQLDLPIDVSVGDLVLFSSKKGIAVEIEDTEYLVLREDDLLAVLSE